MDKNYDLWFPQKKQLNQKKKPPSFKEREIWWTQIGVNIGYEIFGKSNAFTRPVLVLKKFSQFTFLGAPLSTAKPRFAMHYSIEVNNRPNIVMLDQLRTFDSRRLQQSPIQRITPAQQRMIKKVLAENLLKK